MLEWSAMNAEIELRTISFKKYLVWRICWYQNLGISFHFRWGRATWINFVAEKLIFWWLMQSCIFSFVVSTFGNFYYVIMHSSNAKSSTSFVVEKIQICLNQFPANFGLQVCKKKRTLNIWCFLILFYLSYRNQMEILLLSMDVIFLLESSRKLLTWTLCNSSVFLVSLNYG